MVDATREVPALIKAVRAGLLSMPQAIRQQGYDPDLLLNEEAAWRAKTAAAGVRYDTNPADDLGREKDAQAEDDTPDDEDDNP
jgi:capsid protein